MTQRHLVYLPPGACSQGQQSRCVPVIGFEGGRKGQVGIPESYNKVSLGLFLVSDRNPVQTGFKKNNIFERFIGLVEKNEGWDWSQARMEILKGCRWKVSTPTSQVCFLICWLHSQVGSLVIRAKWLLMGKYLPWFPSSRFRALVERALPFIKSSSDVLRLSLTEWVWVTCPYLNQGLSAGSEISLFPLWSLSQLSHPGSSLRPNEGRKQATPSGPWGVMGWEGTEVQRGHGCVWLSPSQIFLLFFLDTILMIVFSILSSWACPCELVLAHGMWTYVLLIGPSKPPGANFGDHE